MRIQVHNPNNLPTIPYTELEDLQGDFKSIANSELKKLKSSIIEHGIFVPKFVWGKGKKKWCLDGHQTKKALSALEEEGYEIPKIPIVYVPAKDKKNAIKKLLVINSRYGKINRDTSFLIDYNFELDELENQIHIPELDLERAIGYEDTEGDDDIPEDVKPMTKEGDLWELNQHQILCGDAKIDKDKLINIKIDLLFTDPPYGLNIVNNKGNIGGGGKLGFVGVDGIAKARVYRKIINDDKIFDPQFLLDWSDKIILFGANNYTHLLPLNAHWLVWAKKPEGAERKNTFSDAELLWTNIEKKTVKLYRHIWFGLVREGKRDTELTERMHPTQKPVGLVGDIILDYTNVKNNVVDVFLGSGSTLIACEKTNRICYGMEIEPYYCDIIVNRFKKWCVANDKEYILKLNSKEIDI